MNEVNIFKEDFENKTERTTRNQPIKKEYKETFKPKQINKSNK